MVARIADGNQLALMIQHEIKERVWKLKDSKGVVPGLAVLTVGEDYASQVYVRNKTEACKNVGIYCEAFNFPASVSEAALAAKIEELNNNPRFHGILVSLPLPPHISEKRLLFKVSPLKDVDGFHPINVGKFTLGHPVFIPCTPLGILEILKRYDVEIRGKHVVIVGRSDIVGKPIALLLLQEDATVTMCHSKTKNIQEYTKNADILIVAVGRPGAIKGNMVGLGAVVIDVGINRIPVTDSMGNTTNKLVGDVVFDEVKNVASLITPVPGGVGPLTVTMLLSNTVKAAEMHVAGKHEL
ncbi:MAG: bifunctional methylenetetrahydrofolate dehydrogenase/methenyltetrahydrofolate cyclohydrolase FolD [Thermoplasmata archaeon]